jgi:hypothetical protein
MSGGLDVGWVLKRWWRGRSVCLRELLPLLLLHVVLRLLRDRPSGLNGHWLLMWMWTWRRRSPGHVLLRCSLSVLWQCLIHSTTSWQLILRVSCRYPNKKRNLQIPEYGGNFLLGPCVKKT